MRFATLSLERYGRFEGCQLQFRSGEPDLHVIYGANEAGKSTTLAAVSDLLFGFPFRSPYNFRFDYSLLRVGAVLEADGISLNCRRRKAGSATLVDAEDRPVDESILLGMLRGQTRDTFRLSFSLDQERLRLGGRAMIAASDDLGQTLFAAGSGLTGVTAALSKIEEEADAIWGRRAKSSRTYTQAERELADSQRTIRDEGLKPKTWTDARNARDVAEEYLTTLEAQRAVVQSASRKSDRIRRIRASVAVRAGLSAELASHIGTVELTPRQEHSAEAAITAIESATAARVAAEQLVAQAGERAAAIVADPAILAEGGAIDALVMTSGAVAKAARDLARLTVERDAAAASRDRLRHEAGPIANAGLTRVVLDRLRKLARSHGEVASALRELQLMEADLEARLKPLAEHLADAEPDDAVNSLAAAIEGARRLGADVDARCAADRRHEAEGLRKLETALARLVPWTGSIDALLVLPTIEQSEIDGARLELAELAEIVRREEQEAERLAAAAAARALEIRSIPTGAVVTHEEITASRQAREAAWVPLRAHLAHGTPLADPVVSIEGYERTIDSADAVSDRRFSLAQASTQLAVLDRQRADDELGAEQARGRAEQASRRLADRRSRWEIRLREAGLPPFEPLRLQAWVIDRGRAVEAHAELVRLREEGAARTELRRAAAQLLLAELPEGAGAPDTATELSPLLRRAERLHGQAEERRQKRREDRLELKRLGDDLESQRRRRGRLALEGDERLREWDRMLEAAGAALDINSAEGPLDLLDELRQISEKEQELASRIAGIDRDALAFQVDLARIAGLVGLPVADDPAVLLGTLQSRLRQARENARVLDDILAERDRRAAEASEAAARIEAHEAALAPLLIEAGAGTRTEMVAAIERSRLVRRLKTEIADAERQILSGGDGYSLDELISEAEAEDPDRLAARASALDQELAEFDVKVSAAATARGEARRAFEALDNSSGKAMEAAAAAEQARAEMSEQAEAYLLRRAQALMLRWAIEQYRERHQDPLLARAGQLFEMLTLGRYVGLRVEFDDQAPRLLGISSDGRSVIEVGAMSEGTTDQLFLSLRLAALEQSMASGVRLPFLADDLFVNFDDDRAEAGFRVLAEFARSTQVLFFTHHPHLAAIARKVVGAEIHSECALA